MVVAGDANLNKGITSFEIWPYSGKEACEISTEPGDDCGGSYGVRPGSAKSDPAYQANFSKAEANGMQKLVAIEKLETSPPNTDEIKAVLASGSDLWIAMSVGSTWMGHGITNGNIPDWYSQEGGHAIVMAGYRKNSDGKTQYLIHNSWGESWADHGYGWINESMLPKWLRYAYKLKLDAEGLAKVLRRADEIVASLGKGFAA